MKRRELISAGVVSIFTFLSRVLGLIRDIVLANILGAGISADAFYVAFRIPNTFRRFFGEGAMTVSFIPVFTEVYLKHGEYEAKKLASSVFTLLSMVLFTLTVGGVSFSPFLVKIFAPGFVTKQNAFHLTVDLLRIMFPYILFISLVALFAGILNSLRHFGAPAFAPALLNLSIITMGILFASKRSEPTYFMAGAVLIGGIAQLLLQVPFLINKKMLPRLTIDLRYPASVEVIKLLFPAVFSAAIYQINILIITALASFLAKGSISYLYYAGRFIEFPLGILIFPLTAVILPKLSADVTQRELKEAQNTLGRGLNLALFLTLPASAGLILLSEEIISLFLKGGKFQVKDVMETSYALIMYSTGIIPIALSRLWTQIYYSFKDFKTPAFFAFLSLLFNIILAVILMKPLKHGGLALATSISSIFYTYLLARSSPLSFEFDYKEFSKNLFGTIIMIASILIVKSRFAFTVPLWKFQCGILLFSELLLGLIVYLTVQKICSSKILDELLKITKK